MKIIKDFEKIDDRKLVGTFRRINEGDYILYEKEHGLFSEAKRVINGTEQIIANHINGQYDVDDNFIVFELANNQKRCFEKVLYSIKDNKTINFLAKYASVDPVFERVFTLKENEQDKGKNVMQIKAQTGDITFYISLPDYKLLPYAYSSLRNQIVDVKSIKKLIDVCNEDKEYKKIIEYFCRKMNYDLNNSESDMNLLRK